MREKSGFKYSKKIAVAGILTAFLVVALILENILPTGKLGFYVFAGFLLSVVIMECGILFGWASFAVSSLLAALVVPEKTAVVPYVLFFGIYSLVKSHIEKLNRAAVELVLKFVFFNAALYLLWQIALMLIPQRFFDILPVAVIIVLLEILFFVYDWIFSLWIQFYQEKLRPKISRE
ncbi:MAG TPA: hypothetical protein DCE11_09175 [Ruminiclostridium sp.]|jgi:hypothetical protein|nr:hypothetical protein [Clostridiaceae bacterium]HAA26266.1 hypothetical protein [Ruminiclostridium sp.]